MNSRIRAAGVLVGLAICVGVASPAFAVTGARPDPSAIARSKQAASYDAYVRALTSEARSELIARTKQREQSEALVSALNSGAVRYPDALWQGPVRAAAGPPLPAPPSLVGYRITIAVLASLLAILLAVAAVGFRRRTARPTAVA